MKRIDIAATWLVNTPSVQIQLIDDFRLDHIRVSVDNLGITQINDVLLNNESTLLNPIDAFTFSKKEEEKILKEFKKQNNLEDKNEKQILKYLVDNQISLPDPCYILLDKVVKKNGSITILGNTSIEAEIIVSGLAR